MTTEQLGLLTDWENHDDTHDDAEDETPPRQFGIPYKRGGQGESERYDKH